MSLTPADMAKTLRNLADSVESMTLPVEIHLFEHHRNVIKPEAGEMVADYEYRGRSIVIHIGDLHYANNGSLSKRLK